MCAVTAPPDLKRGRGGETGTMLEVWKVRMIRPYWDMPLPCARAAFDPAGHSRQMPRTEC